MREVETVTVTDDTVLYLDINGDVDTFKDDEDELEGELQSLEAFTIGRLCRDGRIELTCSGESLAVIFEAEDRSISVKRDDVVDVWYDSIEAWLYGVSDGQLNYQPST